MPTSAQAAPSRLTLAARDIKLAHSVFALPFAILGAALAADFSASPAHLTLQLVLIVLCMVAARTWAMLVNRLADARIDAKNPRTTRRAMASGDLSTRDGRTIALASAFLFCAFAFLFWPLTGNPWPAILCVPVLGFIALYSYTKRFTALCHAFLGAALALSPVAAVIAIEPTYLAGPTIWLIAGFVLLWVAGFDIIYALQDLDFDRAEGLHSVPAALGWKRAIWVSRLCHLAAFTSLTPSPGSPSRGSGRSSSSRASRPWRGCSSPSTRSWPSVARRASTWPSSRSTASPASHSASPASSTCSFNIPHAGRQGLSALGKPCPAISIAPSKRDICFKYF